jgi:hypothetical protein
MPVPLPLPAVPVRPTTILSSKRSVIASTKYKQVRTLSGPTITVVGLLFEHMLLRF